MIDGYVSPEETYPTGPHVTQTILLYLGGKQGALVNNFRAHV